MTMTGTIYDSRDKSCKAPFGALRTGQTVTFTVHLPKTLPGGDVILRIFEIDHEDRSARIPMEFFTADLVANSYRCVFASDTPAVYLYHFELHTPGEVIPIKRSMEQVGVVGEGELWQLTVYDAHMRTPSTMREGVMYQIFPDRFRNSGLPKDNVPADRTLRSDWRGLPVWRPNQQGEVTNSDYFCGDLRGITEKLDYLVELGVTVLYLNPVFEAHSNHRYNTADYRKIDPLLGTDEDFRSLCSEAKKRGISVILDGVFSHTGSDSLYFNKNRRYGDGGAYNDPGSPYSSWYRFRSFPNDYESWWGFPTLPNVEETDPSYLDFICGKEGVLRHWMRMGASGFRLDVADELPDEFLDRLHDCVKAENPNAAIIGEVWEDASNKASYGVRRRYLLGRQLDSVMNYPFKDALLMYIRYGGGSPFFDTIMGILENYPQPVIPLLMNSLSTHDTVRAITFLGGDQVENHDRPWQEAHHHLSHDQYHHGKRLFILASVIQYGLPGIPCLYYGDEAGLYGYKDPFNRTCYPWGEEDQEILDSMKTLGGVRKEYPIFAEAEFIPVAFNDHLCAFLRRKDGHNLLFAVNRSDREQELAYPFCHKRPTALFCHGSYQSDRLSPFTGVVLHWQD